MAITEKGYSRPTFDEILTDLTQKAQELFGQDIDVSEQTPLGKFLNIMAFFRAKDYEEAEMIYYARFFNTASGTSLDRLCPFVGISRNSSTPAQFQVEVTGEAGTTVPIGFIVATASGVEFYNTTETTIAENETTCTIVVECTEAGTIGNVAFADITEIVNPEAGISSVIGTGIVSVGKEEESDSELRKRMAKAGEGLGSSNEVAIKAALLRVPSVSSAAVVVNDTDETDEAGNLPHSIACYVAGGIGHSQEIAEAIFATKPVGIKTNGSTSVEVIDDGGYSHTIKYSAIADTEITVKISIKTNANFEGETGITKIQNNIKNYINSLGVGNDVIHSAMYGYIYSVVGVEKVTSLTLSNDGTTFDASDITISALQNASCSTVEVTRVTT